MATRKSPPEARHRTPRTRLPVAAALAALALLALAPTAHALEQKVVAADGAAGDRFGESVAVEGDTAVVGAPFDDGGRGAVYVFTRTADTWAQTARLTASDGAAGDVLGRSVAIDGDTIVAGAPRDDVGANVDQGSVYTFARTGAAARTETAKLTASDGAADDEFGFSVAIDGDTIVAGAPFDDVGANSDQGSAYTFARTGAAARAESAKLTASDGAGGDTLGRAVAIDDDTIVAGAPFDDVGANSDQGSAYTFARTGAIARTETAKLTASDGAARNTLGRAVALDGDTIVVGANGDDFGGNTNRGSVYTFARTGAAARTETAKLTASDGTANDFLGASVAIDGDTIVAGALGDDVGANASQGSASLFFPPAEADLALSKSDSPDPVTEGSELTYLLEVDNRGPDDATGVEVTDTLPTSVEFVSASTGCGQASGTVTCDLGRIAAGQTDSARITVRPTEPGTLTNTATVSADEDDPRASNDSDSEQTTVEAAETGPAPTGHCRGQDATVTAASDGDPNDGVITGTPGADVIVGTGQDDTIRGRGGDDLACGRGGHDTMVGGSGDDRLLGALGGGELRGGSGDDDLRGGRGRDDLRGGSGDDGLHGSRAADDLRGGSDDDDLRGGRGRDDLRGGSATDRCGGGGGVDSVRSCEA